MMKKDWNEGLNHIAPDIVEEYIHNLEKYEQRKSKKGIWLRFGAVAASFCIIIGALITIPMLFDEPPITPQPPNGTDGNVVLENDTAANTDGEEAVTYAPTINIQFPVDPPKPYGYELSPIGGGTAEHVRIGVSVTARLLEIMPDTYFFYDDSSQTEFRLIKMETVTVLAAKKMADTFYYIVPVEYMTDFTRFDKFVFCMMAQYGYDHSVLYNKTQGCAEILDIVLFGYSNFSSLGTDFMAFDADGNRDLSLYDEWGIKYLTMEEALKEALKEAEKASVETGKYYYGEIDPEKIRDRYTLEGVEKRLRKDEKNSYSVLRLDELTDTQKEILEYIKKFENGLYIIKNRCDSPVHWYLPDFLFRRYIGGYPTNERGGLYTDINVWNERTQFTEDDLLYMPDLTSAIEYVNAGLDNGSIVPPHISDYSKIHDPEDMSDSVFGWYAKTDDGVIGVVRIRWEYDLCDDRNPSWRDLPAFDDAYYIIEYGSDECKPIDRDALLERLGECDSSFIYKDEYGENGVILYEPVC